MFTKITFYLEIHLKFKHNEGYPTAGCGGHLAQQLSHHLGHPHSLLECLVGFRAPLLPFQLAANVHPGRQHVMTQVIGSLPPM